MISDINNENRLAPQSFADHLGDRLGWGSDYTYNMEIFGPHVPLGRASKREVVLVCELLRSDFAV